MVETKLQSARTSDGDPAPGAASSRMGRRRFAGLLGAGSLGLATLAGVRAARSGMPLGISRKPDTAEQGVLQAALDRVAPVTGYRSRIALQDSAARLSAAGVIDLAKLDALYAKRGAVPLAGEMASFGPPKHHDATLAPQLRSALRWPTDEPITIDRETAGFYLMTLWPVGLANRMQANETSPVNGDMLNRLASTSGWTLGGKGNGAAYFNRHEIVALTPEQEALVVAVAEMVFRPCCNNSTFYQDCNHGSAMLGLLELGAAQGLTRAELYHEALMFNAYWFSEQYAKTAVFFKLFQGQDWAEVDPEVVTSYTYSALTPWQLNVDDRLAQVRDLLPLAAIGGSCSL